MSCLEKGLQSSASEKRRGASRRNVKGQKKTLAPLKTKNQMILETYLLVEGQRIDRLLLSVESMLSVTRDLIQNNEMIPTPSLSSLKEQNEVLSKQIKKLKSSTFRKFKRKITKNWISESTADVGAVPSCE